MNTSEYKFQIRHCVFDDLLKGIAILDAVVDAFDRIEIAGEKAAAEQALTVITAAYDVIAGKYGDGDERKTTLTEKYGEERHRRNRLDKYDRY